MTAVRRVLFLCNANACRSQMAEGWARNLWGDRFEARSAGVEPGTVDPRAVKVMAEAGVDISHQRSKGVEEFSGERFDLVVTLCGGARERCPLFPDATRVIHRGFDDPPALASVASNEEEAPSAAKAMKGSPSKLQRRRALDHYRRVRDEIGDFVAGLPGDLLR